MRPRNESDPNREKTFEELTEELSRAVKDLPPSTVQSSRRPIRREVPDQESESQEQDPPEEEEDQVISSLLGDSEDMDELAILVAQLRSRNPEPSEPSSETRTHAVSEEEPSQAMSIDILEPSSEPALETRIRILSDREGLTTRESAPIIQTREGDSTREAIPYNLVDERIVELLSRARTIADYMVLYRTLRVVGTFDQIEPSVTERSFTEEEIASEIERVRISRDWLQEAAYLKQGVSMMNQQKPEGASTRSMLLAIVKTKELSDGANFRVVAQVNNWGPNQEQGVYFLIPGSACSSYLNARFENSTVVEQELVSADGSTIGTEALLEEIDNVTTEQNRVFRDSRFHSIGTSDPRHRVLWLTSAVSGMFPAEQDRVEMPLSFAQEHN